jgi:hypothetical protein
MTESLDVANDVSSDASAIIHAVEPPSVLVIGGVLGGSTFLLCALLLGVRSAVAIAALGALFAVMRRLPAAAIGFAAAAAMAAAGFTTALLAASAIFGVALALFARARMRARVAASIDGRTHHPAAASF